MLRFERLIGVGDLESVRGAWESLLDAPALLRNPFFRPEFCEAVAATRPVEATIVHSGAGVEGLFAFERAGGVGFPVGRWLSDHHGLIVAQGSDLRLADILSPSGLCVWEYHHSHEALPEAIRFARKAWRSWNVDLSGGYAAYVAAKRSSGSLLFERLHYLERRLAREVEAPEFTFDDRDPSALAMLMEWKSSQYCEFGHPDVFARSADRELIERLFALRGPGLKGVLSTLRVGERLVAAHFGLATSQVLHYWFPSYSRSFAAYSPGLLLLDRICAAAADVGIVEVDLGGGDDAYKLRFASGFQSVLEGTAHVSSLAGALRSARRMAANSLRGTRLASSGKSLAQRFRGLLRLA